MATARKSTVSKAPLPDWIQPQLSKLAKAAPSGDDWAHEIKYDGYRMHARLDRGSVRLLTRSGLDWTANYPAIAAALAKLPARQAYIDGELCGVLPDGSTSFSLMQAAHEKRGAAHLAFFAFDLLHVDGQSLLELPLVERKVRLEALFEGQTGAIQYSGHVVGGGARFRDEVCKLALEGVVSKRLDAPYRPGNRGLWVKTKCVNREEFVVVGWTDPEGSRPHLGALLLAYYAEDGRLVYAGRAGTGMSGAELKRVWQRLKPLASAKMPIDVPPPRKSRFGSPLVLSRVHWVRPEMVVEVTYMTWTDDGLLRHVVYLGVREDKSAADVRRDRPPVREQPTTSKRRAG